MAYDTSLAYNQLLTLEEMYRDHFSPIDKRVRNSVPTADILSIKRIYAIGDGDSYHAALSARDSFLALTRCEYMPLPAMRFLGYEADCMRDYSPGQSLVIGISASGGSMRVVQGLKKARERLPNAHFIAMVGNSDSAVARSCDIVIDTRLPGAEKFPAPGIRTYAANLYGLINLALRFGEIQNNYHNTQANNFREQLLSMGGMIPELIKSSQGPAEKMIPYAKSPFFMFSASGSNRGSAIFSAAKFTEIAGIHAVASDLEEWNHVERFSYPLETPLIVIAPGGASFDGALKLMENAKKMGHPIIAITDAGKTIKDLADIVFPMPHEGMVERFSPLLYYIPSVVMACVLGKELKRGMFMSDNEGASASRVALTKCIKEEM